MGSEFQCKCHGRLGLTPEQQLCHPDVPEGKSVSSLNQEKTASGMVHATIVLALSGIEVGQFPAR
jgi:hypothetical protein